MSRAQLTSTVEQNTGGIVPNNVAGKNLCINGGFDIWQRGTSSSTDQVYLPDRWWMRAVGTTTNSQSTDVPSGVPVQYSIQGLTAAGSSFPQYHHSLEQAEVIPLRGQTVVVSWYMKANSTWTNAFGPTAYYSNSTDARGSLSTGVTTNLGPTGSMPTTSWARYYATATIPSDAVGFQFQFNPTVVQASGASIKMTAVQIEVGTIPTPFARAGGRLQGELALCQRYYYRQNLANNTGVYMTYLGNATMSATFYFPTIMRVTPSATCNINSYTTSNSPTATQVYLNAYYVGNLSGTWSSGATTIGAGSPNFGYINLYGWTSPTTGLLYSLGGGTSCYADWSAEL